MNVKCIQYSCVLILLFCIELRVYYNYIVDTYFNLETVRRLWKGYINPEGFSYGMWDTTHNTIKKANENLYSFMHTQANINKTHTLLQLGAKNRKKNKKWDRIIAIESEPDTIVELKHKLKQDGVLVCSMIVLNDNTPSSFYIDTVSDFLSIPKLSYSEWKQRLEETFTLVELHDMTPTTLNPYHNYLFNSFVMKKGLPQWVADTLIYYFHSIPFQYMIAVCKK